MEQGVIINLNEYKKKKGIALPRSPYYTLDATKNQVHDALATAARSLDQGDYRRYAAAVVGYENIRTGKIKLLKGIIYFATKEAFESMAGIKGHRCIGLIRKAE
jgi:hypothetical protein